MADNYEQTFPTTYDPCQFRGRVIWQRALGCDVWTAIYQRESCGEESRSYRITAAIVWQRSQVCQSRACDQNCMEAFAPGRQSEHKPAKDLLQFEVWRVGQRDRNPWNATQGAGSRHPPVFWNWHQPQEFQVAAHALDWKLWNWPNPSLKDFGGMLDSEPADIRPRIRRPQHHSARYCAKINGSNLQRLRPVDTHTSYQHFVWTPWPAGEAKVQPISSYLQASYFFIYRKLSRPDK